MKKVMNSSSKSLKKSFEGLSSSGLKDEDGINLGSTAVFHNAIIQKSSGNLNQMYNYNENDWLLVCDGAGSQKYTSRSGMKKTVVKWGQMKLFITELQFFNKYWDPVSVPNPICVYVGAATGNHIYFLAKMFPQIEFHLYDGRDFDQRLRTLDNIKIYVKLFTDIEVQKYSGRNDILFISDIRSLDYFDANEVQTEEVQRKNEEIAMNDMKLQMDWVLKIKPVKAHLKFRLPYKYDWVKESTFSYLDGDIYKQPFAPHTSTETRLIPDLNLATKNWDFTMYESMMFYHNNVVREHVKFINPLTGINESISEELGLLQDFDSVVFITTVKEYLEKFTSKPSIDQVIKLSKAIIEDIGAGVVNFANLRAGMRGTLTSAIKSRVRKVLEDNGENENE